MQNSVDYKNCEILAPAGGQEQLLAAVRCGANAVYLGLQGFNARGSAENFNSENIAETIKYCKAREVKVYITLNTLVFDNEINAVKKLADAACLAGASGIIVQDLAVAKYIREKYPDIKLIASTQMAVHNVSGAEMLKQLGFSRVVLARELSLNEIKIIAQNTDIETEVFIHGAHCASVSGQCYMSSVMGARSGNRGQCGQACRLPWDGGNNDHSLSLKDMCLISYIRSLAEAGVSSFKIEGRMKRAEYVAASVTACKKALAGEEYDLESLRKVFSRSGFTDEYLTAKRSADMFGFRTKDDVVAAKEVLKDLEQLYQKETFKKDVDMVFECREGQRASLTVKCNGNVVTVDGPVPQQAIKRPIDESFVKRGLEKTGDTVFALRNLECHIGEGLMLPLSVINEMRRKALDLL